MKHRNQRKTRTRIIALVATLALVMGLVPMAAFATTTQQPAGDDLPEATDIGQPTSDGEEPEKQDGEGEPRDELGSIENEDEDGEEPATFTVANVTTPNAGETVPNILSNPGGAEQTGNEDEKAVESSGDPTIIVQETGNEYSLYVASIQNEQGSVEASWTFASGTQNTSSGLTISTSAKKNSSVTVTAYPNSGYAFSHWQCGSETVSYSSAYTFTIDKDYSGGTKLVAYFESDSSSIAKLALGTTEGGSISGTGAGGNAVINANGSANYSLDPGAVSLTATAASGYEFKGWYQGVIGSNGHVESNDGVLVSASNPYSFIASAGSSTVLQAVFEPTSNSQTETVEIAYNNVAGNGSSWTKGSADGLGFTFKRNVNDDQTFSNFTGVQVDGADVAADNYTAEAGSVVVTLKASYLETLSEDDHTLTATFSDGEASATFTVKPAAAGAAAASTPQADRVRPAKGASPQTGDSALPLQATLALAGAAACALAVAAWRLRSQSRSGRHSKR